MRRCLTGPCRVAVLTLHTSPAAAPGRGASGGLNVYVKEVCRCLSELGVETDVFTRVEEGAASEQELLAPRSRLIPIAAGEGELDRHRLKSVVPQFTAAVGRFAAERREQRQTRDPEPVCPAAPDRGLVHERLADVEEDRLQGHRASVPQRSGRNTRLRDHVVL